MYNDTIFTTHLPNRIGDKQHWGQLTGLASTYVLCASTSSQQLPLLVITPDMQTANQMADECRFLLNSNPSIPVLSFPDWEILPYDRFSPHQDIISDRLMTLYSLPGLKKGLIFVPVHSLMHLLGSRDYIESNSLVVRKKDIIKLDEFKQRLSNFGYQHVSQVFSHGEFNVRGSIIDIFPMGTKLPYRIDLLDDEVDTLRTFDPETQCSINVVDEIFCLPGKEFPFDDAAITRFREKWRDNFHGNPANSIIYNAVTQGEVSPGIEYYLPLFFENTSTLFDYLPKHCAIVHCGEVLTHAENYWLEVNARFEQFSGDIERPILPPDKVLIAPQQLFSLFKNFQQVLLHSNELVTKAGNFNYAFSPLPDLSVNHQANNPLQLLEQFIQTNADTRILICAESPGRREVLHELINNNLSMKIEFFDSYDDFIKSTAQYGLCIASISTGLFFKENNLAIISEAQFFGEQIMQRRRRANRLQDPDAIIRNLTELQIGSPVVHITHGVGRYQGLKTIVTNNIPGEYLTLEYAKAEKLYIPVQDLHLISRYTGADGDSAPLHQLGSNKWNNAKKAAAKRARDVAAELLNIYSLRHAKVGHAFTVPLHDYDIFSNSFPFEETPDQLNAINAVIEDLKSTRTMDRLVCGDVGFGKTEVAMRAAFIVASNNKQVVVLVPTTLLCEQHYQNFRDRFANWPIRIASISRFRTPKEQQQILEELKSGKIDIIIGTHKLLQTDVKFDQLGLLIIDEEHRFGVRQKERMKALRAEVDVLALTATPIPRTLNLSLTGIRDLSIIATPPARRHSILTFVRPYDKAIIREAILREIMRGGQVYYLHNDVKTINAVAQELSDAIPEAKFGVGHGQMPERELEKVMADFYHHRFNVLICTTIIESGIDIPTANSIIIQRADKFGLAQLHQIRGRVGRSHHQAYAYLLIPDERALTADAKKRLEAISSLDHLGAGFILATHDLEIRGAGAILGEEQSGNMNEIGFNLYLEMLDYAVKALRAGITPELELPMETGPEIDLHLPALIPDDYIPDIQTRLNLYKRIASATNDEELKEIRIEIIDRFSVMPQACYNLFQIARLKLIAKRLGIQKITIKEDSGRLQFVDVPKINVDNLLNLIRNQADQYQMAGRQILKFTTSGKDANVKFTQLFKMLEQLQPTVRS